MTIEKDPLQTLAGLIEESVRKLATTIAKEETEKCFAAIRKRLEVETAMEAARIATLVNVQFRSRNMIPESHIKEIHMLITLPQ